MKGAYREQRSVPLIETFLQDTRYAVRGLLRTKGFTAAALVTLALGIGANTAIFSVVNAILLRPLDYPEPDRILQMHRRDSGLWAGQTGRRYMFFRDQMRSFEALAAWRGTAFNLVTGDTAEYVNALAVSKEYFTVFGGTPLYGRVFDAAEDTTGGPPAVCEIQIRSGHKGFCAFRWYAMRRPSGENTGDASMIVRSSPNKDCPTSERWALRPSALLTQISSCPPRSVTYASRF